MLFEDAMSSLGLDEAAREPIRAGWSRSMAAMPIEWPEALAPSGLRQSARYCGLDDVSTRAIDKAMSAILGDKALLSLLWHFYFQLTVDRTNTQFKDWPHHLAGLDDLSGMLYLLVALGAMPKMREGYERLHIPEEIIQQTCLEIPCFAANHQTFFEGRPGICPKQMFWLTNYLGARLFRLGRFEYMLKRYDRGGVACRNSDGDLVLLAGDGWCFDEAGLIAGKHSDSEECWKAELRIGQDEIVGHPMSPKGTALRQKMTFSRNEWTIVLQNGSWFLDMHIPSGGGMNLDVCRETMSRAFEFFAERFPESRPDAIMCWSWIFNTQFEEMLPGSNLSQLIQRCYIFPIHSDGKDGMYFVFGPNSDDLGLLPRDSSLQRAMIGVLEGGGRLRSGGMFMHRDDLDAAFDSKVYRTMFERVVQ